MKKKSLMFENFQMFPNFQKIVCKQLYSNNPKIIQKFFF